MVISQRLPRAGLTLAGLTWAGLTWAGFLALACPALATDYLRGAYGGQAQQSSSGVDWAGVYGGVHAGFSSYRVDPDALRNPLAKDALPYSPYQGLLHKTINPPPVDKNTIGFGVFGGVNWQWDDVVLGFESDYTRASIKARGSYGPYGVSGAFDEDIVGLWSRSTFRSTVSQWATIRGRAGWAAGFFMPYLTAGLALAQADTKADVTGSWERYNYTDEMDASGVATGRKIKNVLSTGNFSGALNKSSLLYGAAIGAGIDMQIMPNTFLRAEWQHIQFAPNGAQPDISINTARVAGGVKF